MARIHPSYLLDVASFGLMSNSIRLLFGNTVLAQGVPGIENSYGGQFQYLTVLGACATWLVFLIALVPQTSVRCFLQQVILPVEFLITLLWYGLTLTIPHLMVPPSVLVNRVSIFLLPPYFDLSIHFLPFLLLLISRPPFSLDPNPWLANGVLTLLYSSWIEKCKIENGWFAYPFLDHMSLGQRIALYIGAGMAGGAFGAFVANFRTVKAKSD